MTIENLPTHVKEMRNFIAITSQVDNQYTILQEQMNEISSRLVQVHRVVENLEEIGLEKLALLFSDRAYAEIILSNCSIFRKKINEGDTKTAEKIGEAFSKILEKIDRNKFDLINLSEGQKQVLTGSFAVLFENYNSISIINEVKIDDFLEDVLNLIQRWESHKEQIEDSAEFSEGIETGLMKAALELKELYEKFETITQSRSVS